VTIPTIDGIQGLSTSGTELTSFSIHVLRKLGGMACENQCNQYWES